MRMRVIVLVGVGVRMGMRVVVRGSARRLMDVELRRRHARPEHTVRRDLVPRNCQAAERSLEVIERQAGVEEGAEQHVP